MPPFLAVSESVIPILLLHHVHYLHQRQLQFLALIFHYVRPYTKTFMVTLTVHQTYTAQSIKVSSLLFDPTICQTIYLIV